ncbi:hypothetical protein [Nocardioides sp. B-3]|uniref:hypothetical protein n=1 Tax=Nocardioides sp. B-3 TaxID=2895565 RepID=UPI002152046E|nr:hypothetical protein [Nocardioides sp. B-3]UUZ59143.1 hypothetical protein LP418_24970 [Nocardioides sp. B-3]
MFLAMIFGWQVRPIALAAGVIVGDVLVLAMFPGAGGRLDPAVVGRARPQHRVPGPARQRRRRGRQPGRVACGAPGPRSAVAAPACPLHHQPTRRGRGGGGAMSDLLLVGADVVTMDPGRPSAEAIPVRDGMVVAVGTEAEVAGRAPADADRLDLEGATVVPGLIESHVHPAYTGLTDLWADCRSPGVASIADLQAAPGGTARRGRRVGARLGVRRHTDRRGSPSDPRRPRRGQRHPARDRLAHLRTLLRSPTPSRWGWRASTRRRSPSTTRGSLALRPGASPAWLGRSTP